MNAWNFQKRFAPDVAAGVKRSTIRAKRADGRDPEVGDRQAFLPGSGQSIAGVSATA